MDSFSSTTYIHQRADWPAFRWDVTALSGQLAAAYRARNQLLEAAGELGFQLKQETLLSVIAADVEKSSEIEGERLDKQQVRSSIARRLGMDTAGLPQASRQVEGVVEMMLDAIQGFDQKLTKERLFSWHASLFPTGVSGFSTIRTGVWRDDSMGPMQVVSGAIGHETVHFVAPSAERVEHEMEAFLRGFELCECDPLLHAGVAHLWFLTIHPFDDGNGRLARAILDMALARWDGVSERFYSMSSQIHRERETYYQILERTQKASLDITQYLQWFLECVIKALVSSDGIVHLVRRKGDFWAKHLQTDLNLRERKVVNMLLDGFQGNLQTSKYARIAKCSTDTALRDLSDLVSKSLLRKVEGRGGRSTCYELNIPIDQ